MTMGHRQPRGTAQEPPEAPAIVAAATTRAIPLPTSATHDHAALAMTRAGGPPASPVRTLALDPNPCCSLLPSVSSNLNSRSHRPGGEPSQRARAHRLLQPSSRLCHGRLKRRFAPANSTFSSLHSTHAPPPRRRVLVRACLLSTCHCLRRVHAYYRFAAPRIPHSPSRGASALLRLVGSHRRLRTADRQPGCRRPPRRYGRRG